MLPLSIHALVRDFLSNQKIRKENMMDITSDRALATSHARGGTATLIAVSFLGAAALLPSTLVAQEISDEWQFGVTVYGWFPDIGGNTGLALGDGRTIDVDISTLLDHLKMTAQGSFEIQKGRWGAFTDIVYLDVGESKSQTRGITIGQQPLPGSIDTSAEFDLKSTIWTLAGSYRSVASADKTIDLLVGARLTNIDQHLNWAFTGSFGPLAPPPRTGARSASVDQWDAILGTKGRFALGAKHNWVVPFYFDIGAGDSDLTWQAMLGLGYAFGWGDVGVAWRYLEYELDGPISDLNFNGPGLGVTFRW